MIRMVNMLKGRPPTAGPVYQDPAILERQRQASEIAARRATRPRKIEHWAQGLHQMADAGLEGYREGQFTRQQQTQQRDAAGLISALMNGKPDKAAFARAAANPLTRDLATRMMQNQRAFARQKELIGARESAAAERARLADQRQRELIEWKRGLPPTEREKLEMDVLRRKTDPSATGRKPPSGYRYKDDGETLQVIPGGPADKVPFADSAKIAMMDKGLNDLNRAEKIVEGLTLGTRAGMAIDSGEGFELQQIVQGSIEAFLRAMTGAAAPESEVQRYMDLYGPEWNDRPSTMKRKLADLKEVINRTLSRFSSGRAERSEPAPKLKIERID